MLKDPSELKPGDKVKWTSQAGGRSHTKVGTVLLVRSKGANIHQRPRELVHLDYIRKFDYYGRVMVIIRPKGRRGQWLKPRVYSPRLSALERVRVDTPDQCPLS